MKNFLTLLLLLVLAGGAAYQFYLKDNPPTWLHGLQERFTSKTDINTSPGGKKDFKGVCAQLQGDMDRLPTTLRENRQMPTHAFEIKTKVAPHLQLHEEYRTLDAACDTIINADQDFDRGQGKCGFGAVDRTRAAGPGAAAYQQQQALWEVRRRQAEADVRAKLATLENHLL